MATYVRYATRAKKHEIDLSRARSREEIASNITAVQILDKGTGSFTLTFVFPDKTEIHLDQSEVANGQRFAWDISSLLLTNAAQAGLTLKLLTEQQIL